MHGAPVLILCIAALVRSTGAVAPEDEHDDGDKAGMLFQVHSSGRVQHTLREDAPLQASNRRHGCDQQTVRTRINNDEVEHELSYARDGSSMHPAFKGIWWMDQRGRNVGPSTTPGYHQSGSVAADEFLVTFGDAYWNAGRRCADTVPVFGGQQGHWTWADQDGNLDNAIYNLNCGIQLTFNFCCKDDHCNEVDINGYVNARDTMDYLSSPAFHGLGWAGTWIMSPLLWGLSWWNGHSEHFSIPTDAQSWHMVKTSWGYDRLTVMCSSCWSWMKTRYHYPLFQIVDGSGQRTRHYDAYLRFANEDGHVGYSSFATPMNRGNGTSFVGRARP